MDGTQNTVEEPIEVSNSQQVVEDELLNVERNVHVHIDDEEDGHMVLENVSDGASVELGSNPNANVGVPKLVGTDGDVNGNVEADSTESGPAIDNSNSQKSRSSAR